jgi:hypothetical protein
VVPDNFFKLPGCPSDIDSAGFIELAKFGGNISSKIFRPALLKSPTSPQRWRIKDCQFSEVSFSKTLIEEIEFKDCTFTSCLFLGTIFKHCRFTDCTFIKCNTYRIEFTDVYISPRSFDRCLDRKLHQNIGVYLYQELLNNSRQQSQPDFAQDALFEFRRWLRFEQIYKLRRNDVAKTSRFELTRLILQSWLSEKLLGFGVRLRNYCLTAVSATLIFALINYHFSSNFGLNTTTFVDALYFTTITLTTIGYGDITPTTMPGRLMIAGEGITGFVLLAILASMVYRKISP